MYSVLQFISFPQDMGKGLRGVHFLRSNFCILACDIYCVTVGFLIRDQGSETGRNAQGCKGSFGNVGSVNEIQMPARLFAGVAYRQHRKLKAERSRESTV